MFIRHNGVRWLKKHLILPRGGVAGYGGFFSLVQVVHSRFRTPV
ncbi:hypothetical protein [Thioflexithrix psekupsensis]|nr:hypothetical protein [Thioflexithrix psekupsensis]